MHRGATGQEMLVVTALRRSDNPGLRSEERNRVMDGIAATGAIRVVPPEEEVVANTDADEPGEEPW